MLNNVGTKIIETERLILRRFEYSDNESMRKNWISNEKIQSFYCEPVYNTEEEVKALLDKYIGSYVKENYYRWAIIDKESKELISLMIFEENGKPVGFANLMHIFSIWAHGKALVIDDLYLKTEARGKGYGRQALGFIEEFAEKTDCNRLQFQSEVTNPDAMKFYMAMGYQPADMKFYVKYFK